MLLIGSVAPFGSRRISWTPRGDVRRLSGGNVTFSPLPEIGGEGRTRVLRQSGEGGGSSGGRRPLLPVVGDVAAVGQVAGEEREGVGVLALPPAPHVAQGADGEVQVVV